MTKRIQLAYGSLSPRSKVGMTIAVVLMLLISFMLVASASSGITFSNQSPTATVQVSKPTVSVDVYSPDTEVTASNISMTLGDAAVIPGLTSAGAGIYNLSYTPTTALQNGPHTVSVQVYDSTTSWNFTVDAAPNAIGRSPVADSTVTVASPTVSLTVRDTYNKLNPNSVVATLNGQPVTTSFQYKGHLEYDSCGGSWYVIDDYKEGTITLNTGKLANGEHTIQVRIKDDQGNELVETWKFTAAVPIKFSYHTPANGSTIGTAIPTISVRAYDGAYSNGDDYPVIMLVDDVEVSRTVSNLTSGGYTISYTPPQRLAEGSHTAIVKVYDTYFKKYVETSWAFTVNSTPIASNWSPSKNGTVNTASPTISLYVSDAFNDLNGSTLVVKVAGNQVPATITYDSWFEPCYGVYTNYTAGTITANATGLANGEYPVVVEIADSAGNKMVETWTFHVKQPPQFTVSPANSTKNAGVNQVTATVKGNQAVDWSTVKLSINGTFVTTSITQIDDKTATVTYNYIFPDKATNQAYLEATDTGGNKGTTSWTFLTDSTPPSLSYFLYRTDSSGLWNTYSAFEDGLVVTNGVLYFTGQLKDMVDIKNNVSAALSGTTLTGETINTNLGVSLTYRGHSDSCTGVWIVTDRREASISYSGGIKDGDYTMALTYEDELGNKKTNTVSFQVRTPPVMSNFTPITYGLQQLRPQISAIVKDLNGAIVPATIQLTLNGTTVAHEYDSVSGKVSYTPTTDLADESYQTLVLNATDDQGLITTRSWKFYTNANGYADMADSSYTNCTACHSISNPSNALESTIHSRLEFSGGHGADCEDCHAFVSVEAGCSQCHGGEEGEGYEYAPHGSTPSISYGVTNYDQLFPIRVKTNREMFDCVICHQPGVPLWGYEGSWANPTRMVDSHDYPDLHRVTVTADNESCVNCHAKSLTREHAREGRLDTSGQQINCNTCHKSTDTSVQSAITNNNKDCSACHEQADHESLHTNTMDTNCTTCHNGTLTTEHMNNSLTTGGKGYDCNTCHNSERTDVKRTIAQSRLNCTGCHSSGHDVKFADNIPLNIPLYSGFDWTTPMETRIFAGESSSPAGYELGQVVMSNRSTHATAAEIWDYYYNNLVTTNGWTLNTGTAPTSGESFKAEYVKSTNSITIFGYNTLSRDGTGSDLGAGYRIEIWYK